MAKTISVGLNNDIVLELGNIKMVGGKEAYGDIIRSAILTVRGELQLDLEQGIPYFETVFSSVAYEKYWKDAVRKRILAFPFVRSIISFESNMNTRLRLMTFTIKIETDEGVTTVSNAV